MLSNNAHSLLLYLVSFNTPYALLFFKNYLLGKRFCNGLLATCNGYIKFDL